MHAMQSADFATAFNQLYREIYRRAVRRVADARDSLSPETVALMLHLAEAGPMSLAEMSRHLGRAPSTLSVKVDALEAQGMLARQRDRDDARRSWIWLSAEGRHALDEALQVLDAERVAVAAATLAPATQDALLIGLRALIQALPAPSRDPSP